MNRNDLILRAKELVNNSEIKGPTAIVLKNTANSDLKTFEEYLKEISEQAWDPQTLSPTINTYGEELVDISMKLFPKSKDYNYIRLDEKEIKGGKADKISLNGISKKFKVEISKLEKELTKGIKVELEHTKDKTIAKDIAMDHLSEIPDYYTRLEKLEKDGTKKWSNESTKFLIKKILKENLNRLNKKA
jgi:hypothetical protein